MPEDGSVKDGSAVWRSESQGYSAASKQLAPPVRYSVHIQVLGALDPGNPPLELRQTAMG